MTFRKWWAKYVKCSYPEDATEECRRASKYAWESQDCEIAGLRTEVERLRAGNEALRRDLSEAKDSIQEYRWGDDL